MSDVLKSAQSLHEPTDAINSSIRQYQGNAFEKKRRWIVRLIFLYYWLFFLEGALRKWVFPDFHQFFFFVRDPITIAIYFLSFSTPFWPRDSRLWTFTKILFVLCLPTVFLPRDYEIGTVIFAYGFRNFFFFIPLFFIVMKALTLEDLKSMIRQTFIIALPVTFLVLNQFNASPTDPINVGFGVGYFRSMEVMGKFVRPSGPFGSVQVQNVFVAALWSMVLACWFLPKKERFVGPVLLILASLCVITSLAVGGSRGAFVHAIAITGFLFAILFLSKRVKQETAFSSGIVFFIVLAMGSYLAFSFYSEPLEALYDRASYIAQQDAEVQGTPYSLGILNRVIMSFIDFTYFMDEVPIFGQGIGTSTNAASSLGMTGLLGENDWSRQIIEMGPLLGLAYILLRVGFSYMLFRGTLHSSRKSGISLPFLLGGFVTIILINGQITGNGSITGIIWFFSGLAMNAAANFQDRPLVQNGS